MRHLVRGEAGILGIQVSHSWIDAEDRGGWNHVPAVKKYMRLFGAAVFIFVICHAVLPRLTRVPCLEVVRNNVRQDIDATAYFYTEMDDFSKYEEAVKHKNEIALEQVPSREQ